MVGVDGFGRASAAREGAEETGGAGSALAAAAAALEVDGEMTGTCPEGLECQGTILERSRQTCKPLLPCCPCLNPGSVAHFQRELLSQRSLPAGNSCQLLFLPVPVLEEQPAVLQSSRIPQERSLTLGCSVQPAAPSPELLFPVFLGMPIIPAAAVPGLGEWGCPWTQTSRTPLSFRAAGWNCPFPRAAVPSKGKAQGEHLQGR